MICPNCRSEYVPGVTRCYDCGLDLVDVAPPKPKPALVELGRDSFVFKGEEFAYADVEHIEREATKTSINLIPVAHKVRVTLWIRGRSQPLDVENFGFIGTAGKIDDAYQALATRTLRFRVEGYLRQWYESGHFDYAGLRFFDTEEVGYIDRPGEALDLNGCRFSWMPFEICFKPRKRGRKYVAGTLVDQDALFVLLRQLFGIRFGEPTQ